jgi:hypothetical protein
MVDMEDGMTITKVMVGMEMVMEVTETMVMVDMAMADMILTTGMEVDGEVTIRVDITPAMVVMEVIIRYLAPFFKESKGIVMVLSVFAY